MTDNTVKVKVSKDGAAVGGRIRKAGETVDVAADKVARLVERKLVEAPAAGGQAATDKSAAAGQSALAGEAIDRLGAALSTPRLPGEGDAQYLERVTAAAERRAGEERVGGANNQPPLARDQQPPARENNREAPPQLSGPLPEEFPGRKALGDNGIKTWEKLLALGTRKAIVDLKGIGDITADQIIEATNAALREAAARK